MMETFRSLGGMKLGVAGIAVIVLAGIFFLSHNNASARAGLVPIRQHAPSAMSEQQMLMLAESLQGEWGDGKVPMNEAELARSPHTPSPQQSARPTQIDEPPVLGIVKSVATSSITLIAPEGENIVELNTATEFYRITGPKSKEEFQKELQEYSAGTTMDGPSPYERTAVGKSDIKQGDPVTIEMGDGKAASVSLFPAQAPVADRSPVIAEPVMPPEAIAPSHKLTGADRLSASLLIAIFLRGDWREINWLPEMHAADLER
jgi:hypothetical protein